MKQIVLEPHKQEGLKLSTGARARVIPPREECMRAKAAPDEKIEDFIFHEKYSIPKKPPQEERSARQIVVFPAPTRTTDDRPPPASPRSPASRRAEPERRDQRFGRLTPGLPRFSGAMSICRKWS